MSNIVNISTTKIGSQIWMTQNLNVEKFRSGDKILCVKTKLDWINAGKTGQPAWCYYNNNFQNEGKYGKLYNWYAINDIRGIAPVGFHIPSDNEWETLSNSIDKNGFSLISQNSWPADFIGTNNLKFSALPGGYRFFDGVFFGIGLNTFWWSSTQNNSSIAWCYYLRCPYSEIFRYGDNKNNGFSVRCLRD